MTKKIITVLSILTTLIVVLTGCPMALDPVDSLNIQPPETKVESETGITITVPRIAPGIIAAATQNTSRAIAFTDSVEIIVKDSSNTVISSNVFNPDFDGSMIVNCSVEVAPGTGYSLTVNIYNNYVSEINPVVSGTAAGIDVTSGITTSVTVTCIPVNPVL